MFDFLSSAQEQNINVTLFASQSRPGVVSQACVTLVTAALSVQY